MAIELKVGDVFFMQDPPREIVVLCPDDGRSNIFTGGQITRGAEEVGLHIINSCNAANIIQSTGETMTIPELIDGIQAGNNHTLPLSTIVDFLTTLS
jgi:hypothetical protein